MSGELTAMGDAARAAPSTRVRGGWLWAARVGWLLLLIVALGPFFVSAPAYLASVEHPSPANAAITPGAARALLAAGVTLHAYAL
ncbi:MAG TPA: hypothetical protein VF725_09090, partial [Ktedonobacterales bacterium]